MWGQLNHCVLDLTRLIMMLDCRFLVYIHDLLLISVEWRNAVHISHESLSASATVVNTSVLLDLTTTYVVRLRKRQNLILRARVLSTYIVTFIHGMNFIRPCLFADCFRLQSEIIQILLLQCDFV
jgi:hypothetical protein